MYNHCVMKIAKLNFKTLVVIGFLIVVTFPYVWAELLEGQSHVFSGFLINPKDGYSYLAKMRQGFEGNWRYTFPFSKDGGQGAYLFLYYLFLGHLARIAHLDLIYIYHLMRLLNAGILAIILWNFYQGIMGEEKYIRLAFVLALFGSGFGWFSSLLGYQTSDLWVSETFPFLSSYSNPHFPLSLGIMIWLMNPSPRVNNNGNNQGIKAWIVIAVLATVLAAISPFAVIMVVIINGVLVAWEINEDARRYKEWMGVERKNLLAFKSTGLKKLLLILMFSAPVLLYDWWISRVDPVVAGWSAQNITHSPPIWDFIISFSPALLIAIPGGIAALKERRRDTQILLVWILCGLGLIYFPFGLQRRFMLGYFIPVAGLASLGLKEISRFIPGKSWLLSLTLLLLSIPTNLLIIMTANYAGIRHDENIYLSDAENTALTWLKEEVPGEVIVLAAPQTGLIIPPLTGHRALYGHPFETIRADYWEKVVTDFFQGTSDETVLSQVDYIYYGRHEKLLGGAISENRLKRVFENEEVTIYKVER